MEDADEFEADIYRNILSEGGEVNGRSRVCCNTMECGCCSECQCATCEITDVGDWGWREIHSVETIDRIVL
jgi:hypothetical protein